MFGKRKDSKHRYAEEAPGDLPDAEVRPESDDEDLAAALLQLGRNRHVGLPEPQPGPAGESDGPSGLEALRDQGDQDAADESGVPDRPVWAAVQTAAMLAEPEPEPEPEGVDVEPNSGGEGAMYAALRRERAKVADQDAAVQEARNQVASLKAELKQLRRAAEAADAADVQAAPGRVEELELSLVELQSKVSALTADLERARSEAAAAEVALERVEREAKEQERAVAAAEQRAEQLAAEIEQLRAAAATGPAQVERLHREAERERTMRATLDQAQASHAQAEAALADNLRLASELAANLESQEGLIAALTGLQVEVTEQRAWFEAQIASVGETETRQASVIESLRTAIEDRDIELETLRQQLLDAEAKRAEEAAAFLAMLDRQ